MFKTCVLIAAVLTLGPAAALAQPSKPSQAAGEAQTGAPAPAVGVVFDPDARTVVVVPVNPQTDVSPEVTAMLKALTAQGKVRPGQIVQVVVRHGNEITQVISNAPVP